MTVMAGTQPGLTVADIQLRMSDLLGYDTANARFAAQSLRWINDTLQEIQLNDPQNRRTRVHDEDFNVVAGQEVYNVRDAVVSGGFGWDNCSEVIVMALPAVSPRPMEFLNADQWRQRAHTIAETGPPYAWVNLDPLRVRIVPKPDSDYVGKGDYYQDIPAVSLTTDLVDWPRIWDAALIQGVEYRGLKWEHQEQPSVWIPQFRIFEEKLAQMKSHNRTTSQRPRKAVLTRNLRSRRQIPRDRSTDTSYRGRW